MMMVVIFAEDRGNTIQWVVYSVERVGMMKEERCDLMMVVVLTTKLLEKRNK